MTLIFVHGWGFDASFWDPLISELPDVDYQAVEFGYLGSEQKFPEVENAIFITHSLGTMWALKHYSSQIKGLIAINGFPCFQEFVDARVLKTMQKRLIRTPDVQMQEFWAQCGAENQSKPLDIEGLKEGLDHLANWDMRGDLRGLDCPVLSFVGDQDQVTSLPIMEKEWAGYDLKICAGGGHVLPLTHTKWCAGLIEDYLNGFSLEDKSYSAL